MLGTCCLASDSAIADDSVLSVLHSSPIWLDITVGTLVAVTLVAVASESIEACYLSFQFQYQHRVLISLPLFVDSTLSLTLVQFDLL